MLTQKLAWKTKEEQKQNEEQKGAKKAMGCIVIFMTVFKAALSREPGSCNAALLGMYLIQEKWIYSFRWGRLTAQKLYQVQTGVIESTPSRWKQSLSRAQTITAVQIEQQKMRWIWPD